MARRRKDGTKGAAPNRRRLDDRFIKSAKAAARRYLVWDTVQKGLALAVEASGSKSYKFIYAHGRRTRWLNLGSVRAIGLADARAIARDKSADVIKGGDPQAERAAARRAGSFEELAQRYRDEHAKKNLKAWKQGAALIDKYVLPAIGKLPAATVEREHMRTIFRRITDGGAPVMANQVLAATSAVFAWGIQQEVVKMPANPCAGIKRNETTDRERVLTDAEVRAFWAAFDDAGLVRGAALRVLLLTGQRPGEVSCMRCEHIERTVHNIVRVVGGKKVVTGHPGAWWNLPGLPDPKLGWNGTKNKKSHRVWLTPTTLEIIDQLNDGHTGFVFDAGRGHAVRDLSRAMQSLCASIGLPEGDKITPHDLRRTHGTTITKLRFGREAMNRIENHKEGGIADVYDLHDYADEFCEIQEAVGAHILSLVDAKVGDNVVPMARP